MTNNIITFTPDKEEDLDFLQIAVHGWWSVLSMREPYLEKGFYIDTDNSVKVEVDLKYLQNLDNYTACDLYEDLKSFVHWAHKAAPTADVNGMVIWEDQDHAHRIYWNGDELCERTVNTYREMTVDEISKELGYRVKVVGDGTKQNR